MSAIPGKIEIVDIGTLPGGAQILTAYGPRGQTRDTQGQVWPASKLTAIGATKPGLWRASRDTAEALLDVDRDWKARSGKPLRLTDGARDPAVQAAGRMKYEAWLAAGSPSPGSSKFVASSMKAAFVGKVNGSNHQWGGANDWDVRAMCANDEELSLLWDIADDHGFYPIIARPSLDISECWHFDHLGDLRGVREAFKLQPDTRHSAYTMTAEVGCILAGTFVGEQKMERYAQARLMVAAACNIHFLPDGPLPGIIDGVLGTKTIACAKALGLNVQPGAGATDIITALDEKQLGHDIIAGL